MTQTAKKPYNYCMDFLKGLACIFVVFIHVKFPGDFGQAVQAIARFAVPFFFMVSGYYYFRPDYQGVIGGVKKYYIYSRSPSMPICFILLSPYWRSSF